MQLPIYEAENTCREWYEDGKMLHKKNTFYDFIDAGKFLIKENYTSAEHLYAWVEVPADY